MSGSFAEGTNKDVDQSTGQLEGLLIVGSASGLNSVTVKIRDNKRTFVLANRLTLDFISALSNFENGLQARGHFANQIMALIGELDADVDVTISSALMDNFERTFLYKEAMYLPLGHISLGKDKELEVIYNHGEATTKQVDIYTVHTTPKPDAYLEYDKTLDLDKSLGMVRQVWYNDGRQLIGQDGEFVGSINVQLDIEGEKTYLFDQAGMYGMHNVFGQIEGRYEEDYFRIFSETGPLPANLRCKVVTDSSATPHIVYVREVIPTSVSLSTVNNLDDLISRIEKLEREEPEVAKAYRHSGAIVKSDDLKEAKASVE